MSNKIKEAEKDFKETYDKGIEFGDSSLIALSAARGRVLYDAARRGEDEINGNSLAACAEVNFFYSMNFSPGRMTYESIMSRIDPNAEAWGDLTLIKQSAYEFAAANVKLLNQLERNLGIST